MLLLSWGQDFCLFHGDPLSLIEHPEGTMDLVAAIGGLTLQGPLIPL